VTAIQKKLPRKRQKRMIGDANWEKLLTDAKTRQSYLVESSRVLQSSANCVADELIESMNISNTN
jgi:hypothetical protein